MRKKIIAMLLVIAFIVTPICNVSKAHVVQRYDNKTTVSIDGRQYDVVANDNIITVTSNADNGKVNMVLGQKGNVQICSCDNYGHTKSASMKIDEISRNNFKAVLTYDDGTTKRYNSIDDLNVHSYSGQGVASAFAATATLAVLSAEALIEAGITATAIAGTLATEILVTTAAVATVVATITVAGMVYEQVDTLIQQKNMRQGLYFYAHIDKATNALYISKNPITFDQARIVAINKGDVYTFRKYDAELLAHATGPGYKGPEIDAKKTNYGKEKNGLYYYHYHPWHRNSHIFYGNPVKYGSK